MVVEPFVAGGIGLRPLRTMPEKCQGGPHTLAPCLSADPPAVDAHGERRQPESDRRDARDGRLTAAVFNQAVVRIGLIPEIVTFHRITWWSVSPLSESLRR